MSCCKKECDNTSGNTFTASYAFIVLILFILLVWIKLGLLGYAVRRLHDANYSGWWLWLIFIPFGWIIVVIFLLLPTVEEPVRWGSYLFVD